MRLVFCFFLSVFLPPQLNIDPSCTELDCVSFNLNDSPLYSSTGPKRPDNPLECSKRGTLWTIAEPVLVYTSHIHVDQYAI